VGGTFHEVFGESQVWVKCEGAVLRIHTTATFATIWTLEVGTLKAAHMIGDNGYS